MIPVLTKLQIDAIHLERRPLLICDVDDVVVHFLRDFEDFLGTRDLELRLTDLHLRGSIFSLADGTVQDDATSASLVQDFFMQRTAHMQAIEGAVDGLLGLSESVQVVMLTNLPHEASDLRKANMKTLGLPFPVVTNSGPKGPAVRALAAKAGGTVAFVDDNHGFLRSAHDYAPDVKTVHFLHDDRLRQLSPVIPGVRSDNWTETAQYLQTVLTTPA
jgi:hypothetical protein